MTVLPPTLSGAVYDRGYRPYEGPRGGRREAGVRAVAPVGAPGARACAARGARRCSRGRLLAIATVPAVVNVGDRLRRQGRPGRLPGLRVHHLPRVRRGVDGAAAVRGADRARRRLPRPQPAGAPAVVLAPAHRRRLRRGQGGRHRRHRVRFRVPAPGRAVRRPDARRQRRRARLLHRPRRGAVAGACGAGAPGRLLRARSAWRWRRSPTGGSSAAWPSWAWRWSRRRSPAIIVDASGDDGHGAGGGQRAGPAARGAGPGLPGPRQSTTPASPGCRAAASWR